MGKIKNLLKKSVTVRYWVFVVGKPAFWDALPISKLGDRIMDIFLTLIVATVFLAAYGKIVDPSLQLGFNLTTILLWFVSIFIFRLFVALIRIPAKIFKEQGGFIENPFEITT